MVGICAVYVVMPRKCLFDHQLARDHEFSRSSNILVEAIYPRLSHVFLYASFKWDACERCIVSALGAACIGPLFTI
jgi:hypothetical protein